MRIRACSPCELQRICRKEGPVLRLESFFRVKSSQNLNRAWRLKDTALHHNNNVFAHIYILAVYSQSRPMLKLFYAVHLLYSSLLYHNASLKEYGIYGFTWYWSYEVFFVCITTEKVDSRCAISEGGFYALNIKSFGRWEIWSCVAVGGRWFREGKTATKLKQRENSQAVQIIRR